MIMPLTDLCNDWCHVSVETKVDQGGKFPTNWHRPRQQEANSEDVFTTKYSGICSCSCTYKGSCKGSAGEHRAGVRHLMTERSTVVPFTSSEAAPSTFTSLFLSSTNDWTVTALLLTRFCLPAMSEREPVYPFFERISSSRTSSNVGWGKVSAIEPPESSTGIDCEAYVPWTWGFFWLCNFMKCSETPVPCSEDEPHTRFWTKVHGGLYRIGATCNFWLHELNPETTRWAEFFFPSVEIYTRCKVELINVCEWHALASAWVKNRLHGDAIRSLQWAGSIATSPMIGTAYIFPQVYFPSLEDGRDHNGVTMNCELSMTVFYRWSLSHHSLLDSGRGLYSVRRLCELNHELGFEVLKVS